MNKESPKKGKVKGKESKTKTRDRVKQKHEQEKEQEQEQQGSSSSTSRSGVLGHIETVFGPLKKGCPLSVSTKTKKGGKSSNDVSGSQGRTLYEILNIESSANDTQIRKAYFMMARTCHPDKCKDQEATAKFQALSMIHDILSNEEKRGYYNETGEILDDMCGMGATEGDEEDEELRANRWKQYFKGMFEEVTIDKLETFSNTFIGSEEEKQQILNAYKESKGKITSVIDSVFFASDASEDRIRAIIDKAIHDGEIKTLKYYKTTIRDNDRDIQNMSEKEKKKNLKRKRKAEKEAEEAEALFNAIKNKGGNTSLMSIKDNRMRANDDFVDSLMNKYVKKKK